MSVYDVIRLTISETSTTKMVVQTFTDPITAQDYADKLNLIAFAREHYIPVPIPKPDRLGMCYKGKQQ